MRKVLLNVTQSLDAIRANMVRAGVTIFIIALGITALVVVRTSIEGIKAGMSESFSALGSNTFNIRNFTSQIRVGGRRGRGGARKFPPITYRQAIAFQEEFTELGVVTVTNTATGRAEAFSTHYQTNPNIGLLGADQYYLQTAKFDLQAGRFLSEEDVNLGRNVVVLGAEVKDLLFPHSTAVGQQVTVNNQVYEVIGSFERVGTTGMSGTDRTIIAPLSTLRSQYPNMGSMNISVFVEDPEKMKFAMEEAAGVFRRVRGLPVREESDFSVTRSDSFVDQILQSLSMITIAAQVIAIITLLGASVALLNVMLVSVTERTNEIGLRKALGATQRSILWQFLIEAIVICQVGGLLGILMGVVGGNLVSNLIFKGSFVIPWGWVMAGLITCFVVGLSAGLLPARKAAKVDPIIALQRV